MFSRNMAIKVVKTLKIKAVTYYSSALTKQAMRSQTDKKLKIKVTVY